MNRKGVATIIGLIVVAIVVGFYELDIFVYKESTPTYVSRTTIFPREAQKDSPPVVVIER